MVLSCSDTKEFSPAALEVLFLSVQWESGRHPLYQGCGVGSRLLELCKKRYAGYLNVVLTSYREGVPFYERNGFIADRTQEAMRFIPPSSGETGL